MTTASIPALLEPIQERLRRDTGTAAAPTDTARLLAAVKAVEALHVPVDVYEIDPVNGTWIYEGDERKVLVRLCQACTPAFVLDDLDEGEYDGGGSDADVAWPCATVSAVEAALRGEA